jgi:hypothetical protein
MFARLSRTCRRRPRERRDRPPTRCCGRRNSATTGTPPCRRLSAFHSPAIPPTTYRCPRPKAAPGADAGVVDPMINSRRSSARLVAQVDDAGRCCRWSGLFAFCRGLPGAIGEAEQGEQSGSGYHGGKRADLRQRQPRPHRAPPRARGTGPVGCRGRSPTDRICSGARTRALHDVAQRTGPGGSAGIHARLQIAGQAPPRRPTRRGPGRPAG